MTHITLSVFDQSGKKMCDQFDSEFKSVGQAHSICKITELNGWKELSFVMPYITQDGMNFRWKYITNEYRIRLREGDSEDWFTITRPKKDKGSNGISNTVVCYHISSVLKTKNLYLEFDDENGIDTCPNLISKALRGTGWSLGTCDTIYEKDGVTEKIRSLSSTGKVGSYQLITNICNLFNTYPVYNGATKTVDIHALNDKLPMKEMIVGHNLSTQSVEYNSDNIVTRLYVEGEYSEDGYIGIDDVNPTGLSYLINFDYYKKVGLFTDEHQRYLDEYYEDISSINKRISDTASEIVALENDLNAIWGQPRYVYYVNGLPYYINGEITEENKLLSVGDEVYRLLSDGTYTVGSYDGSASSDMIKFITKASHTMGAKEVAVEAKQKMIDSLTSDKESADEEDAEEIQKKIDTLHAEIDVLYSGSAETEGLYSLVHRASECVIALKSAKSFLENSQGIQADIEATFISRMGDQLKDGYWSNVNYIEGQEQHLYMDALDIVAEQSKPSVSYTISPVQATDIWGEKCGEYLINSKVRIWDPQLQLNDIVFVTKTTEYLDDNSKGLVEISNEDLSITGKTFDSILGRISQLADLVEQKNSLFSRAEAIRKNGTISSASLDGTIDLLKNKLLSSTSNWYTDDNGNIVFLSVNGKSAMMLSGEGFMIANGKTKTGEWNWRTFGTGEGFTADAIITGYLNAERIEAGSIGSSKLSADVRQSLDKVGVLEQRISEIRIDENSIMSIVSNSQVYQNDLNEIRSEASEAQSSADNAQTAADTANQNAENAKTLANNAQSTADKNASSLTNLAARVTSAEQKITADAIVSTVVKSDVYTTDIADIRTLANNAQSSADNAQSSADNAQTSANNAQLSANDALSSASNANKKADTNTSNLSALATRVSAAEQKITDDAIVSTVTNHSTYKKNIQDVQDIATNAQDTANSAQTAASNAQSVANNAQSVANNAQSVANSASSSAEAANTTAESAKTTANSAQTTANEAKQNAEKNAGSIAALGTKVVTVDSNEPASPTDDMMWLDTSVDPSLMKRYDAEQGEWTIVNDTYHITERMNNAFSQITAENIYNAVSSLERYQTDVEGVATSIVDKKTSEISQTVDEYKISFDKQVSTISDKVDVIDNRLSTWYSFGQDALEIGKSNSPFKTKQDNEKYQFINNGTVVASMSGSVSTFPQAYVLSEQKIGGLKGIVNKTTGGISWVYVGFDG